MVGDLWQSRSSQTLPVLLAVRQAILKATQLGIEIVIAEGNHCKIDQESILGYSHIFDHYPNVSVIDDFIIEDMDGGLVLAVMSYFPENGSFINKLNELKATENPANTILYIHEGINGALAQNSDKELSASVFKPFRKVLVGHYHDRCKVGEISNTLVHLVSTITEKMKRRVILYFSQMDPLSSFRIKSMCAMLL